MSVNLTSHCTFSIIVNRKCLERFHEIEGKRCETKEGVPKQEMNRHQHEHHNYGAYARGGYGGYSGYHHHAYYQS